MKLQKVEKTLGETHLDAKHRKAKMENKKTGSKMRKVAQTPTRLR